LKKELSTKSFTGESADINALASELQKFLTTISKGGPKGGIKFDDYRRLISEISKQRSSQIESFKGDLSSSNRVVGIPAPYIQAREKANKNMGEFGSDVYGMALGARSLLGRSPTLTEDQKALRLQQEKEKVQDRANKSMQESFATIMKFQTAISALTGALSVFGETVTVIAEATGKSLNAFVLLREGMSSANDVMGKVKFETTNEKGEKITAERSRTFADTRKAISDKFTEGKGDGAGFLGNIAGIKNAGGELLNFAKGAGLAAGAVIGFGLQVYQSLDSVFKYFDNGAKKSAQTVASIAAMQDKYNIALGRGQEATAKMIATIGDVETEGLSGALSRSGVFFGRQNFAGEEKQKAIMANMKFGNEGTKVAGDELSKIMTAQATAEMPDEKNPLKVAQRASELQGAFLKQLQTPYMMDNPNMNGAFKVTQGEKIFDQSKSGNMQADFYVKIQKVASEVMPKLYNQELQRAGVLGRSVDSLKLQLDLYSKIYTALNDIKSAEQYGLEVQKDSLFTDQRTKDEAEYRIKILEKEKQLTSERLNLVAPQAQKTIFDRLKGQVGGVTNTQFSDFSSSFKGLNEGILNGDSASQSTEKYIDILKLAGVTAGEVLNNAADDFKKQLTTVNQIGESQLKGITLDKDRLAVNKFLKFQYDAQKEALDAQLTSAERNLSVRKEEQAIAKNIKDFEFQRSIIKFGTRTQDVLTKQREPSNQLNKDLDTIRAREAEAFSQQKRNVINEITKRNPSLLENPEKAQTLYSSKDTKTLENAFLEMKQFERQQAEIDPVKISANYFSDEVRKTADFLSLTIFNAATKLSEVFNPKKLSLGETNNTPLNTFGVIEPLGAVPKIDINQPSEAKKTELAAIDEAKIIESNNQKKEKEAIQKARDAQLFRQQFGIGLPKNAEEEARSKYKTTEEINADYIRKNTTVGGGFEDSRVKMEEDVKYFGNTLAKQIPNDFRDSMASAMKSLTDSTKPLKESLMGIANSFLQKINDALYTNLANKITAPITGSVETMFKASGGPIMGGSGNKDDVPAMLMGGEYVIKKSAVQKYGASYLDSLNKGKVKKYASGGMVGWEERDINKYVDPTTLNPYGETRSGGLSFDANGAVIGMDNYTGTSENKADALKKAQSDYYAANAQSGKGGYTVPGQNGSGAIMGQRALLSFATQQVTSGEGDFMGTRGGVSSVNIGAGSANLSLFGLRNKDDSRQQSYLEGKNKAMDLYFGGIEAAKEKVAKEEQIRQEQERIKQEAKTKQRQMYQGMIRQFAISAAMAGISAAASSATTGGSNAVKAENAARMANPELGGQLSGMEKAGVYAKGMLSGGTLNGENAGGLGNMFKSSGYQSFQGYAQGKNTYLFDKNNSPMGASTYGWEKQYNTPGGSWSANSVYSRRAAGGYVAGNGLGDNVPTMLNGGEFVMSKQATQNIGAGKLQQMNTTAPQTTGSEGSSGMSADLSAKFDELIEKLSAVGTINISVNSDGKGGSSEKEESSASDKQAKDLARKVKDVVLQVLRDEKRLGGLLR